VQLAARRIKEVRRDAVLRVISEQSWTSP
jgi:hypothetical protein